MFSTFLVVEQEQDLARDLQRLQRQTASAGFTEYISSGEIQVSTKKIYWEYKKNYSDKYFANVAAKCLCKILHPRTKNT